ncbi:MAG: YigZ family protein [Methanolobus sp.]
MRELIIIKYKTLKSKGLAQEDFRNSVFIAYASPVENEDEAKDFILQIKNEHSDANHNVSAYLINSDNVLAMKYDDDGEPAGSSGKPVFKVLEMQGLSNVVVVVARYFGGIKLGFGGLSRAYRETAVRAIENAGVKEVIETTCLFLESSYSDMETVSRVVKEYGSIKDTEYSDIVHFTVEVYSELVTDFVEKITNATKNRVTVKYDTFT